MKTNEINFYQMIIKDAVPALGCTEPIAVAFCSAVLKKYIKGDIKKVKVFTSMNIYKNGKSVSVPGTGRKGLAVAAAAGLLYGKPEMGLLVLSQMTQEEGKDAGKFVDEGLVSVDYEENHPDVYVRCEVISDTIAVAEVEKSHDRLKSITVDGEEKFRAQESKEKTVELTIDLPDIIDMTENIPLSDLKFVEEGIELNLHAAHEGLAMNYGLGIGKKLQEMTKNIDSAMETRILTAAAADMRMAGGDCPIMTSGGSGNQGINVVIPVYNVAKEMDVPKEKMIRGIFLAHGVNKYVKLFSGKLSGMCGCAIAAGVGASAGITWMLGGDEDAIEGAINNMLANLTGMICDGAKSSCALKLSTCAAEAVYSAKMSLAGMRVDKGVGVIGNDLATTIDNIGRLSKKAYPWVDKEVLSIIKEN